MPSLPALTPTCLHRDIWRSDLFTAAALSTHGGKSTFVSVGFGKFFLKIHDLFYYDGAHGEYHASDRFSVAGRDGSRSEPGLDRFFRRGSAWEARLNEAIHGRTASRTGPRDRGSGRRRPSRIGPGEGFEL